MQLHRTTTTIKLSAGTILWLDPRQLSAREHLVTILDRDDIDERTAVSADLELFFKAGEILGFDEPPRQAERVRPPALWERVHGHLNLVRLLRPAVYQVGAMLRLTEDQIVARKGSVVVEPGVASVAKKSRHLNMAPGNALMPRGGAEPAASPLDRRTVTVIQPISFKAGDLIAFVNDPTVTPPPSPLPDFVPA